MLRDALRGDLAQIPSTALPHDIVDSEVWECTRLVISDALSTQSERATCLSLIVGGLINLAHREGAIELVSLSPLPLMRTLRQLGFSGESGSESLMRVNWTGGAMPSCGCRQRQPPS